MLHVPVTFPVFLQGHVNVNISRLDIKHHLAEVVGDIYTCILDRHDTSVRVPMRSDTCTHAWMYRCTYWHPRHFYTTKCVPLRILKFIAHLIVDS